MCQSSTWRELASVERVLKSNEASLCQKSTKVFIDKKKCYFNFEERQYI